MTLVLNYSIPVFKQALASGIDKKNNNCFAGSGFEDSGTNNAPYLCNFEF